MIQFNGAGYEYSPGVLLRDLAEDYYRKKDIPKVALEDFVIIVNSAPITPSQAEELALNDNDNVYFVPIINGG